MGELIPHPLFNTNPEELYEAESSIYNAESDPFPDWVEGFRDSQVEATEDIVNAFSDPNVRVVFLDAPTGTGKTLIGEMVRRVYNAASNFVCSTKTLQDQFLHDFPYSRVLKGRSNYPTYSFPHRFDPGRWDGISCEDCNFTRSEGCSWCPTKSVCPYEVAKMEAASAKVSILNSSYILYEWNMQSSWFRDRPLTIIDECDTLESKIMSMVEVYISERRQKKMGIPKPEKKTVQDSWKSWVEEAYRIVSRELSYTPASSNDPKVMKERRTLSRLNDNLKILYSGLDEGEWVYTGYNKDGSGPIIFKPVKVEEYARKYLWDKGNRFILMSATVISPEQMAYDLGLEDHEFASVSTGSGFDISNRPVYVTPAADVTRNNKHNAWPAIGSSVQNILRMHEGDNILVHAVSYDLTRYIVDGLIGETDREIISYFNASEREKALERFKKASEGTAALIAPSMDRGVDLPGDLCRVQVICKVPYPYLGDKQVSARLYSKGGQSWYAVETIRSLVQMSGRAVRSKDDYASTYILDSQFISNVYKKNKRYIPAWWKDALVFDGEMHKRVIGSK